MGKIKIAFGCVHNSCRSQIAEAFGKHYLSQCECYSFGSERKNQINQDAKRLMLEHYQIDMSNQYSKLIEEIPECDLYISMGCNVTCPSGISFNEDWQLEDPSGQSDEQFLKVIAEIEQNILRLKKELMAK